MTQSLTLEQMRALSLDELKQAIGERKEALFKARFEKATHQLQDTSIFRRLKHQVAQLTTVIQEKSQGDTAHA